MPDPDVGTGIDAGIDTAAGLFAEHRPVLVGAAYRILGSVGDAEDVAPVAAILLELRDGLICTIQVVGNPGKLAGIR